MPSLKKKQELPLKKHPTNIVRAKVLSCMSKDIHITVNQISARTGISRGYARASLKALQLIGLVEETKKRNPLYTVEFWWLITDEGIKFKKEIKDERRKKLSKL